MATDFSYAKTLGQDEKAITSLRTASNPTNASIARGLGISFSEAFPILDEVANVPATMAAPVASAPGAGQATVAFTPPAANGTPITGYEITSSVGGKVFTTTQLTSPVVVTGLSAGAQTFTIKAINDIGKSVASPASNSVTVT